jgi:hypothetical protein
MPKSRLVYVLLLTVLPACGGNSQKACYSPTAVAQMYEPGAVGCACDTKTDQEVCAGARPMTCQSGRWEVDLRTYCERGDSAVDVTPPAGDAATDRPSQLDADAYGGDAAVDAPSPTDLSADELPNDTASGN